MNLKEICEDLEAQLAWRGPGDKAQGHIVFPRSEAKELLDYIKLMHTALDQLADPLLIPAEGVGVTKALHIITSMRGIAWNTLLVIGSPRATAADTSRASTAHGEHTHDGDDVIPAAAVAEPEEPASSNEQC